MLDSVKILTSQGALVLTLHVCSNDCHMTSRLNHTSQGALVPTLHVCSNDCHMTSRLNHT